MNSKFNVTKKEIDGIQFVIYPFKAIEALRIKSILLKKLGPAVGKFLGSIDTENKNILDAKLDGDKIASSISTLFEELDETTFIEIIMRLIKNVTCIVEVAGNKTNCELSKEADFNNVFQGKLLTVYKLIYAVLEVNYPDFFGLMGNFGQKMGQIDLFKSLKENGKENSKKSVELAS